MFPELAWSQAVVPTSTKPRSWNGPIRILEGVHQRAKPIYYFSEYVSITRLETENWFVAYLALSCSRFFSVARQYRFQDLLFRRSRSSGRSGRLGLALRLRICFLERALDKKLMPRLNGLLTMEFRTAPPARKLSRVGEEHAKLVRTAHPRKRTLDESNKRRRIVLTPKLLFGGDSCRWI